jgi:hypothetical protein
MRHGAYLTKFTPAELAEIAEIEDELRSLSPVNSPAIEPVIALAAGQIWRRDRLFRDIPKHGVTRGRADRGKVAPACPRPRRVGTATRREPEDALPLAEGRG